MPVSALRRQSRRLPIHVRLWVVSTIAGCLAAILVPGQPAGASGREAPQASRLDPLIPVGRAFAAPFRSPQDCRRWRAVADRLGETYAGFRLRQTVVARACAMVDDRADDTHWSWPWRDREFSASLPPRLVSRFGEWEIRCGRAGRRNRCVLAARSLLSGPADPDAEDLPLVAHFVIDQVGGREVLLWRMHVVAEDAHRGGLEVRFARHRAMETFDVCGRAGCIVETEMRLSTDAANWLWDGKPIQVSIGAPGRIELQADLPAAGFRAGLAELMRLRRVENRAMAER